MLILNPSRYKREGTRGTNCYVCLAKQFLIVPALKGEVDSKNYSFLKTEGFFLPYFLTAIRQAKNPLRDFFQRKNLSSPFKWDNFLSYSFSAVSQKCIKFIVTLLINIYIFSYVVLYSCP